MPSYKELHVLMVVENVRNAFPRIIMCRTFLYERKAKQEQQEAIKLFKSQKNVVVLLKKVTLNEESGFDI